MIINWPDETLKALIASRVFGQRVEYRFWYVRPAMLVVPPKGPPSRVPDYPNDIAAAWEIVDWMRKRGWKITLEGRMWGKGWRASIVNDTWGDNWQVRLAWFYAPTAPRAICEAALKALEAAGGD